MSIKGDALIESKSLRESVINNVEVLDRVKKLSTFPDDIHVSLDMAANYFEVERVIIEKTIQRNRNELERDGLKVLSGKRLSDFKSETNITSRAPSMTLIPRRAILRMGMLLRDSEVAKSIRTYLLDIEQVSRQGEVVQIPTELNMIGQLLEVSNQSYKAMIQMQERVDAADKKAETAIQLAESAEYRNKELEKELYDVRSGMIDVNLPLRTQFNDSVRRYARRHSLEWDEAYNNVYSILGKQNHIDLKKRLQNRIDKGEKVKMIDIVEELNLLVPAIRLAKTLAGVAS